MTLFDDIKAIQLLDAVTDSRRVPYGVRPICNGMNTIKFKVRHNVAQRLIAIMREHNVELNSVAHRKMTTIYGVVKNEYLRLLNSEYTRCQDVTKAAELLDKHEIANDIAEFKRELAEEQEMQDELYRSMPDPTDEEIATAMANTRGVLGPQLYT